MIAMCGLDCSDCIAFIATIKNDDKLREKVVEAWSTEKEPLRLEDVDCDGCLSGKRLHSFCQVCDVRKCGLQRNIENCAYCNEFSCGKLEELWEAFERFLRRGESDFGRDKKANFNNKVKFALKDLRTLVFE